MVVFEATRSQRRRISKTKRNSAPTSRRAEGRRAEAIFVKSPAFNSVVRIVNLKLDGVHPVNCDARISGLIHTIDGHAAPAFGLVLTDSRSQSLGWVSRPDSAQAAATIADLPLSFRSPRVRGSPESSWRVAGGCSLVNVSKHYQGRYGFPGSTIQVSRR